MSGQVINWAMKRKERGLPEPRTFASRYEALIDATLMLNPFAMLWLESYGHASRYNTEPAVILQFEEDVR